MLSKTDRAFIQAHIDSMQLFLTDSSAALSKGIPQPKKVDGNSDLINFQQNTKELIAELKKLYGLTPIKLSDSRFQELLWKHRIKQFSSTIKTLEQRGLATYTIRDVGPQRKVMETFTFTKL